MAVGVSGCPGGNRRAVGVARGDTVSEKKNVTLGDYLNNLRNTFVDRQTLRVPYLNTLQRLEQVNYYLPAWLAFGYNHPLREAIQHWDTLDFGAMIGRALTLAWETRNSEKPYFEPEELWTVASAGLGKDDRRGRTQKVSDLDQARMYILWSRGGRTQQELAEEYEVSLATVERIVKRFKGRS